MPDDAHLTDEDLRAFRDLAASFARRTVASMLEPEGPDGNLGAVPGILDEGDTAGLLTSPLPEAAGYEHGVWGSATDTAGPAASLILLEEIAAVCGGVAACFHAQGLGAAPVFAARGDCIRDRSESERHPDRLAAAILESYGMPRLDVLLAPDRDAPERVHTVAEKSGAGYTLRGTKTFVYHPPELDSYTVFARVEGEDDWGCFLVPAGAKGLRAEAVEGRMGLLACGLCHLFLEDVSLEGASRLDADAGGRRLLLRELQLLWLGLGAIAAGTARGGLAAARAYCTERYQGGTLIIEHPAVKLLLAEAETRTEAAAAFTRSAASAPLGTLDGLRRAAMAKLFAADAAFRAVTDSLQTMGGYGYMEDYRMEKRLRDVSVIKSMAGSPDQLRLLIAEAAGRI